MDICPLPWSSCCLTSNCFLQISSSQAFWSQPHCCLPCLAPLTKLSPTLDAAPFIPAASSLLPPMLKPCCSLALPCSRRLLLLRSPPQRLFLPPSPLIFNAVMLTQKSVPTSPAELMRLASIPFFTVTRLHCNPPS